MAKRKQAKTRKQVKRQTRHFQLRAEHPVDQHVKEILDFKKSKRSEVTAIRDGVRLLWALENNDLSVLFEMFPHLKPQIAGGGGGGNSDLHEIKSMLEIVVAGRKSNELLMQSAAAPAGTTTGKQIAAPKFDLPEDDSDDLPTIVTQQSKSAINSAQNLINCVMGLHTAEPPKAVAKKAREVSADEIADNFLNQFG